MPGIVYLLLSILLGKELAGSFLENKRNSREVVVNGFWLLFFAAFGTGTLAMGWGTYLVSWLAGAAGSKRPLLWGNLFVMGGTAAWLAFLYIKRYRKGLLSGGRAGLVADKKLFRKEAVFFSVLLIFLTWIMFYVFHVKDGVLYSGFSVYGDYAPHTAMMRSFSMGSNFPTQYPHYGGEDVKYHFMFQFVAGNLEYLGLRIDIAYNLISILSLEGFLVLLYALARRVAGSAAGISDSFGIGVLSVLLFFFRSAFTFFRFVWEHVQSGDLWTTLADNTSFIGYTPNENWGLWNFNVYLNQRHLAFGLLLVGLTLWIYLDWVEAGCSHQEKGFRWFRLRLFCREAWKSRSLETALAMGMILGFCAFWNGAAVIGGLLILMGFALFSDGKLDYAVTAAVTVVLSLLQSKIFIRGQAMKLSFQWGFLAEDKSAGGVLWYLLQMSGIFFVGLFVLLIFLGRRQRAVLVSFLFPAVFAFCISLTPDINVNHKYVMISYAFLTMFWAWAVIRLFRLRHARAAAVLLALCLTVTGIYDFVVILKNNGVGRRVAVNMESSLTRWLSENLEHEDLLLTPEYSMSEVTMSGVMMYCGWPYYAWSAGYDTNYRAAVATEIYTTSDAEQVKRLTEQEGITYILFEEGMEFEQEKCREDIIASCCQMVYRSEDGRIRIYETR
ncbi:MAG: hypothetical protein Q4C91_20025 [Eubacteriales bacterium]|nr:hypothetical protein [Eubacteriales bacterium]